jgi:hypothetical protein
MTKNTKALTTAQRYLTFFVDEEQYGTLHWIEHD